MRVSKFQRGQVPTFRCDSCGRRTRRTHGDHSDSICGQCYDLNGYENGVSDEPELLQKYAEPAAAIYREIVAKGGTYDFGQSPELGEKVMEMVGHTRGDA